MDNTRNYSVNRSWENGECRMRGHGDDGSAPIYLLDEDSVELTRFLS
uniref:DUF397 domain-containing protein n=1 Tax=Picea sitchensis TaxID=3332 RepID=D5A853_PICSI|nr:unknown [Picea sitchensis]